MAARVSRRGATLLLHFGQESWGVVEVKGGAAYDPSMSKAEFATLDTVLHVTVLRASDTVVHSSVGPVASVAHHELHFTAASPEDRTCWIAGISAGLAAMRPASPALRPTFPDAPSRAQHLPQHTSPCTTPAATPLALASLAPAATSPHPPLPSIVPTVTPHASYLSVDLAAANTTAKQETSQAIELHAAATRTPAVSREHASLDSGKEGGKGAVGGSVDAASHAGTVAGQEEGEEVASAGVDHVPCLVQPSAHTVPVHVEKEEEDGSERWSGLAVSRIACFEERGGTAVAREAEGARGAGHAGVGAVDLEKQWARSVERFAGPLGGSEAPSGAGSREGKEADGGKCGPSVASLVNKIGKVGGGGDLMALMARKRREEEESAGDDGYYF